VANRCKASYQAGYLTINKIRENCIRGHVACGSALTIFHTTVVMTVLSVLARKGDRSICSDQGYVVRGKMSRILLFFYCHCQLDNCEFSQNSWKLTCNYRCAVRKGEGKN